MPEDATVKKLDWAERWLRDGLEISRLPATLQIVEIDMTRATESIQSLRAKGDRVTFTHLIIRAAALALAGNPELNAMLAGNKWFHPATVRIGVSVATNSFFAPVLVIAEPDKKSVVAIANETEGRKESTCRIGGVSETSASLGMGDSLVLRRSLLRLMTRNFENRQKGSGTIQ